MKLKKEKTSQIIEKIRRYSLAESDDSNIMLGVLQYWSHSKFFLYEALMERQVVNSFDSRKEPVYHHCWFTVFDESGKEYTIHYKLEHFD